MKITMAAIFCMAAALLWTTMPGSAATPSSGTLTTTSGTLTYTAGPFIIPNPTSNIPGNTQPQCDSQTPCDDYDLTVNLTGATPEFINTHQIEVTISWPLAQADFDLYVLKGAAVVKDSATSADPEVAVFDPEPGTNNYKVRVAPFAPAGQSFEATIRFIDRPVSPPPPPPGSGIAPRFQTYLSPPDIGDDFGEPSIGANWQTGNIMFYGGFSTDAMRVSFDDCASPAKDTWTPTPLTLAATPRALGDPILYTDRATGRTLVSQLEGGTKLSTTDYTEDDGATYLPTAGSGVNSGVDHQTLGGGPFATGAPPHPLYPNAVYYCAQDVADANCALSLDGGITFGPAVPVYTIADCEGIHGHIKVAPDGTAYVPNNGCGGTTLGREHQAVVVSQDNGITWEVRPVSVSTAGGEDPSVGIASDGTVYFGYVDGDGKPKVSVSHDKGLTWSTPADIGAAYGIKHAVFPVAVAGDPLRAAVGYIGTPDTGDPDDMNTFRGIWHLYIATTYDGGATWTTLDATPNDPVQVGSLCRAGTLCGNDRNLLDFNDATIDKEGRVLIGYSDGCLAPACTTATAASNPPYNTSRSSKAVITRQSGGRRMFATFDPNPAEPKAPAAPRVDSVVKTPTQIVHLEWSEPDNGGSPLTGYKVYRKDGAAGTFTLLATVDPDRTNYDDSTATDSAIQYFYKVTAINAIGEGVNCGEFPIGQAPPAGDPCLLPGIGILSDQSGDLILPTGVTANPAWDVRSLSLAEPFGLAPNKVAFTLKVENLSTVPASTTWPVEFDAPNGSRYVAQMSTVPPATPVAPVFQYGLATATTLTPADAASGFSPDGTITIVVPTSGIGSPLPGQNLSGFLTRIAVELPVVGGITPDNMPDSLAPSGSYTLKGNAFCEPNVAPVANLTAVPTAGPAPLFVDLNGAGSSDPDNGDNIASYRFEFGDGTPAVTQSTPTISHTYNSPGDYRAKLTVIDSRGKESLNIAFVDITVRTLTQSSTHWGLGSLGHVPVQQDYDGDGKTDYAVWQPSDGKWFILHNSDNSQQIQQWGQNGDQPVPADYDQDGKADLAVFRPGSGTWFISRSSNGGLLAYQWGASGDKPVPGDYDGDDKIDLAVFRPSDRTWYILQSSNNTLRAQQWGLSDDLPVPGDYDGDGKMDVAVWRPGNGIWYVFESTTGNLRATQWGQSGDVVVTGDYDADGRTDVAVRRPGDNVWYIQRSTNGTVLSPQWGTGGDIPVQGNYDGVGGTDIAVWRPSSGDWFIILGF
ncbi:MAG: FG-GAP-like repeat-containing protein [Pyrinomonadaceae bacterium]